MGPIPKGILTGVLCAALAAGAAWAAPPAPGAEAPAFGLRELGDPTKLVLASRLFEDGYTLLSFFATWCEPCAEEIPRLRALEAAYADRGFRVVLVCLDRFGLRGVDDYLARAGGAGMRVLSDKFNRVAKSYGVSQLPTNVLVGPDGRVVMAWEMYQEPKLRELEAFLQGLPRKGGGG
ncbi:TlpA disulfide reductase family protein [Deferrisoma sp.]